MASGAFDLVQLADAGCLEASGSIEDSGSTEKSPVLFIHGFMGSSGDWKDAATRLSKATHRQTWAVDLPGHGRSTGLPRAAYTFNGTTGALRDAIHEAGIAPVILAGYSLGGRVAMATAYRMPEFVQGLILESAHPGIEDPRERTDRLERDREVSFSLRENWPEFLGDWYRQPVFASLEKRPELRSEWIRRRAENDPAELSSALVGLSTGRQKVFTHLLDTMSIPILYLAGGLDRKYVEIGRSLSERTERMSFHAVVEAGHNVHAEQPGAYLQVLRSFMNNLPDHSEQ